MPFNPTTENLWTEIEAAENENAEHVASALDQIRRMCGRWYRKDQGEMLPEPENFGYSFVSNMLPTLAFDNPQIEVNAARVVGHKVVSQALEDGGNSWIMDVDWNERHQSVYVDMMMARGITLHGLEEDARFSRGTVTPYVKRISPRRFFMDALADSPAEAKFMGHWFWKDVDDLMMDERVPQAVKDRLTPDGDESPGPAGASTKESAFNKKSGQQLGRRRVKCYAVWIRGRNTIRVLAHASETMELYPETPFYGPPDGPYELYDAYPVPDQTYPLSPIVAVQDQAKDLNIHARAMGRAAARRKMMGLVEASDPDFARKVVDAEDGEVLPVKGLTGKFVNFEFPGATPEQYQYTEYARNRLDRISGLTATVQGNVGAADTATEAQIADAHMSARVDYLKRRVVRATERSMRKVLWYLFHTAGIVIPVNRRDPYSGEQFEGLFFGGPSPTDYGATWDDFDVLVKMNTMQRKAQYRDDTLGFFSIFIQVNQLMVQMPWLKGMNILHDLEDVFDMQGKSDQWMIPELFGAAGSPDQPPPSQVLGPAQVNPRGGPSIRPGVLMGTPGNAQPQIPGQGRVPGQLGSANRNGQTTGPQPQPQPQQQRGFAGAF